MSKFATLMNVLLGYGGKAEDRAGPRYRVPSHTLHYGEHPLQALDLHLHPDSGTRPLLVFMHGGAWQFGDKTRRLQDVKVPFAHAEGWHFASINVRLVPEVAVPDMARDLASAMAALFAQADQLGIDPRKIVLMGHSSGAHLSALLATDPALLGKHGLAPTDVAGVIGNDGAAYHALLPSTASRLLRRRLLDPGFMGNDVLAVSPWHFAAKGGEFPPFLLLHTSDPQIAAQARALAHVLREAGTSVEDHMFPGKGVLTHMRLSRRFGRPGFGPTEVARAWLRSLLAD